MRRALIIGIAVAGAVAPTLQAQPARPRAKGPSPGDLASLRALYDR